MKKCAAGPSILPIVESRAAGDAALADALGSLIHRRAPQRWRKDPGAPLGEVVADKLKERAVLREGGGRTLRVFRWNRDTGELIPVAVPPHDGLHPTAGPVEKHDIRRVAGRAHAAVRRQPPRR